jgi:hypothetical protein
MITEKRVIVERDDLIVYEIYEFDHTLRSQTLIFFFLQNEIKIRHIRMMNLLYQIFS